MIEKSDFNDGDILAKTKQLPCKGGVSFKYTLPDGHPITSDCIPQDRKREMLHKWIDVVKDAAIARARDEQAESAARARRRKGDVRSNPAERAKAEAMGLIVPEGTGAEESTTDSQPSILEADFVPSPTTRPQSAGLNAVPTDPVGMAKHQLVAASLEVQELQPRLQSALQRVAQWQAVLTALQGVELPKESTVIDTNTQLVRDLNRSR